MPCGKSRWVTEYSSKVYGFYLIDNLLFDEDSKKFKPIASKNENGILDWVSGDYGKSYIDSYTIEYLKNNYGLIGFDIIKGLVSDEEMETKLLFGKYISIFYDEKARQDYLKDNGNSDYNPALRETIKLYLNALTGKLVENPSLHFTLYKVKDIENTLVSEIIKTDNPIKLGEINVVKNFNENKYNEWIIAGVMVYSYSKRLLFEYIKQLPRDSDDVIHIETDGIYFDARLIETFEYNLSNYEGEYPCKLGSDLGNLDIEKLTRTKESNICASIRVRIS